MSTPTPPPFDDGGGLPDTTSGADLDTGADTRGDDDLDDERWDDEPNYLLRRAVAVGAIVAVVAVVAIVVGRIIGAEEGNGNGPPDAAAWNTVVVVADDEVRLVDPATGDVTDRFAADEALLDNQSETSGSTLLTMNGFGRITELDLTDGSIRRSSAPEASTLVVSSENASIAPAGPSTGGNVVVVDTAGRTTRDVGELAGITDPRMFVDEVFVNASGTHVAASDASTFQSVLVDIVNDSAVLLAGQIVALDDATVVTAQRAGAQAELEFYDLTGDRRDSVDVPSPVATMLTGESTALIVAADGTIARTSGSDADAVGNLGEETTVEVLGGVPAFGSQRMLVTTSDEVVLLGADGTVLARAPGELLSAAGRPSSCAVIGSPLPSGTAVHLDLDTGEILGDVAGGIVTSSSVDGCTVAMTTDDPVVVASGSVVAVGEGAASFTIAPDGAAYIVTTDSSDRLVEIAGPEDRPVELADEPTVIGFAQL